MRHIVRWGLVGIFLGGAQAWASGAAEACLAGDAQGCAAAAVEADAEGRTALAAHYREQEAALRAPPLAQAQRAVLPVEPAPPPAEDLLHGGIAVEAATGVSLDPEERIAHVLGRISAVVEFRLNVVAIRLTLGVRIGDRIVGSQQQLLSGVEAGGDVLFRVGERFALGLGGRGGAGVGFSSGVVPLYDGHVIPAAFRFGRDGNWAAQASLGFTALTSEQSYGGCGIGGGYGRVRTSVVTEVRVELSYLFF